MNLNISVLTVALASALQLQATSTDLYGTALEALKKANAEPGQTAGPEVREALKDLRVIARKTGRASTIVDYAGAVLTCYSAGWPAPQTGTVAVKVQALLNKEVKGELPSGYSPSEEFDSADSWLEACAAYDRTARKLKEAEEAEQALAAAANGEDVGLAAHIDRAIKFLRTNAATIAESDVAAVLEMLEPAQKPQAIAA